MICPKRGTKINAPWDEDIMSYPKRLFVWSLLLVPTFNALSFGAVGVGLWQKDSPGRMFLVATIVALVMAPITALINHYQAMAKGR
jgi:hypothetical protein